MLPALSAFISGTLTDSFKKLIQPAGLIAAAIFALLNFVIILPMLVRGRIAAAEKFFSLPAGWEALVLVTLILILGYILVSLNTTILSLMSGELWTNTFWGICLRKLQEKRLNNLLERGRPKTDEDSGTLINWRVAEVRQAQFVAATDFPSPTYKGMLAPTKLGNILNATSSHIWEHYKIDIVTLWPPMEIVISEEKALPGRIQEEKASLDFLLNLSLLLYIFAIEYALVIVWTKVEWRELAFTVVFAAMGYIAYQAAVAKARTWGDNIKMAFDLHRDKLRTKLGLPEPKSRAAEFDMWKQASDWLQWDNQEEDPFSPKPPPTPEPSIPSYTASDNVKVTTKRILIDVMTPEQGEGSDVEIRTYVDYLILLNNPPTPVGKSNTDSKTDNEYRFAARGIYVVVSDKELPSITRSPELLNLSDWPANAVTTSIVPSGNAEYEHDLLWHIQEIPANGSGVLHYRLPRLPSPLRFRVCCDNPILIISEIKLPKGGNGYGFTLTNKGPELAKDITLQIFDSRNVHADKMEGYRTNPMKRSATPTPGSESVPPEPGADGYIIWTLSDLELARDEFVRLDCYAKR